MSKIVNNISTNQFQELVFNLKATRKLVRNDTMEGRPFTVVPMVMMTEGVLNGSNGPIYYPEDELAKNPEIWNHKPVVVYHPTQNGQGISACSPDVLTTQKIGVIMNTRWDATAKRLVAEAWLENNRMEVVDKRVAKAVENESMMELSTGLFTDNEQTAGEFNGRKYSMIARNHRPDHLAVLPDKIGACSLKDGAGFIRNESNDRDRRTVTTNDLSHESLRDMLRAALLVKFPMPVSDKPGYSSSYVEYVFDDFLIYSQGGKWFKIDYSVDGNVASLSGNPVEVLSATQFITKDGNKPLVSMPRPAYNEKFATHQERTIAILNAAGDVNVTASMLNGSKLIQARRK